MVGVARGELDVSGFRRAVGEGRGGGGIEAVGVSGWSRALCGDLGEDSIGC